MTTKESLFRCVFTREEIPSLTDEQLAEILNSFGEFPYDSMEWTLFKCAKDEATRRSNLAEAQREARGEQPLFDDMCPHSIVSRHNETNTDGPKG